MDALGLARQEGLSARRGLRNQTNTLNERHKISLSHSACDWKHRSKPDAEGLFASLTHVVLPPNVSKLDMQAKICNELSQFGK